MPASYGGISGRRFGPPPWRGFAVACAVTLATGAVLALITAAATTRGTDYFYYYCVSKLITLGHADQIYNLPALGQLERHLIAPLRVPHGVIPNVYPPFFAVAFVPLAALSYSAGYWVWLVLNCALLGLSLSALERYIGVGFRGRVAIRVATLCSLPVIIALLQGQVSMILLACLTAAFLALRAGREVPAGLALGALLIKPQFALPFLLLLLAWRCWRALAAFAAVAMVAFLAPLPVLGWDANIRYLDALRAAAGWGAQVGGFAPEVNRSFAGFMDLLFPAPLATALSVALGVASLGALVWVCVVASPRFGGGLELRTDIPFALAVVVALVASQHVLIHDLTLLLIPMAVMLRVIWRGEKQGQSGSSWREASGAESRGCSEGRQRAEALGYGAGGARAINGAGPFAWVLLAVCYVALPVGFWLSRVAPVQLPTLAMAGMGLWLVARYRRESLRRAGLFKS